MMKYIVSLCLLGVHVYDNCLRVFPFCEAGFGPGGLTCSIYVMGLLWLFRFCWTRRGLAMTQFRLGDHSVYGPFFFCLFTFTLAPLVCVLLYVDTVVVSLMRVGRVERFRSNMGR